MDIGIIILFIQFDFIYYPTTFLGRITLISISLKMIITQNYDLGMQKRSS